MILPGGTRLGTVTNNVMPAYGFVSTKKDVSPPLTDKYTLGGSRFIPRIGIDRPPTFCGPTHNFDWECMRIVDKASIPFKGLIGCFHNRNGYPL